MLDAVHLGLHDLHGENNALCDICQRDLRFDINAERVLFGDMETIGTRIKKIRRALGMTQTELAEKCGYEGQSRIAGYEAMGKKNGREPTFADVCIIADALDVHPSVLYFGDEVIEVARIASAPLNVIESKFYAADDDEREVLLGFRRLPKEGGGRFRVRAAIADEHRNLNFVPGNAASHQ